MRNSLKILLTGLAIIQFAGLTSRAATYQWDNNTVRYPLNASDGTEPLDNWFANLFSVTAGADLITSVSWGVFTTTPNSSASVVLYRVTDPGGNPALGATRVYTQNFTPLTGDGTNAFLQTINLTTPVAFTVGDRMLVAIMIRNVIAAPPNDVYPFLLDTSDGTSYSWWDRAAPNSFNLDNLSNSRHTTQAFAPGGFAVDPGYIFIRANGIAVPEPSICAFGGLALAALAILRRRK